MKSKPAWSFLNDTIENLLNKLTNNIQIPGDSLKQFAQELTDYQRQLTVMLAKLKQQRDQIHSNTQVLITGDQLIKEIHLLKSELRDDEAVVLYKKNAALLQRYTSLKKRIKIIEKEIDYVTRCRQKTNERLKQLTEVARGLEVEAHIASHSILEHKSQQLLSPQRFKAVVTEIRDEIYRLHDIAEARIEVNQLGEGVSGLTPLSTNDLQVDLETLLDNLKAIT